MPGTKHLVWAYILFGLLGLFCFWGPVLSRGRDALPGKPVDTRLNHYTLEHSYRAVHAQPAYPGTTWSAPFFAPMKNSIALGDNLLGTAPLYGLMRYLAPPVRAYQLWMIVCSALSFASLLWVLRRLECCPAWSVAGAYAFAFGMPRFAQLNHAQLLPHCFAPLALWAAWRLIQKPSLLWLGLLLVWSLWQIAAGIYLGWFLVSAMVLVAAIASVIDGDLRMRLRAFASERPWGLAALLGATLVVAGAFLWPYLQVDNVISGWPFEDIKGMLPCWTSWWLPFPSSLWSSLIKVPRSLPMPHEHFLFVGFWLPAMAVLAAWGWCRKGVAASAERTFVLACLGAALTMMALSFRLPGGFSLWRIVYVFAPGAKAIRAVSRIWTTVYLLLIPAVLVTASRQWHPAFGPRTRLLAWLLPCLVVWENLCADYPTFDAGRYARRETKLAGLIADSDFAYIRLPEDRDAAPDQLNAMWAGLKAGVPVVNGSSSRPPAGYPENIWNLTTHQVLAWLGHPDSGTLSMVFPKDIPLEDSYLGRFPDLPVDIRRAAGYTGYAIRLPLPEIYNQQFAAVAPPERLQRGERARIAFHVRNTGSFTWRNTWPDLVTASYRWLGEDGTPAPDERHRTQLAAPLDPFEGTMIELTVVAPAKPGRYTLQPTMVWEDRAWFEDKGADLISVPVLVE